MRSLRRESPHLVEKRLRLLSKSKRDKKPRPPKRLKFYVDEARRHPFPHSVSVNADRARVTRALRYLANLYSFPLRKKNPIEWRGETISYAYPTEGWITLAAESSWLIFAHEVAHLIEWQVLGDSRHGPRLKRIVDHVVNILLEGSWIVASLDAQASRVVDQ